MYNNSDGSFPTGGWPSIVNTLPNVILHCSSIGGGMATLPQPPDAAPAVPRDAQPTLAWSNPRKALCNAVYFSKIRNDIAATNPAARVLYDGSTVFSNYTHGAALDPGTTYYWGVFEQLERGPMFNEPFSFTTEPLPQTSFPWTTGFENGGAIPPFWHKTSSPDRPRGRSAAALPPDSPPPPRAAPSTPASPAPPARARASSPRCWQ